MRATESGHWYTREGEPCYTVKSSKGIDRPTTLRDARKLDLVPSVTTILGVAAKPGLERWKQEQILLSALTLPRNEGESESDWLDRVIDDSKETGRKAADRGTEIHAAIQAHFEGQSYDSEFQPYVTAAEKALSGAFNDWEWTCEKPFAHTLGYGGKCDLHVPSVWTEIGRLGGLVVDIKTKDFGPEDKVEGYDEHLMQLAAYAMGLKEPEARCANLFISRSHPGVATLIEWTKDDIYRGWQMFTRLLEFYQLKNNYR